MARSLLLRTGRATVAVVAFSAASGSALAATYTLAPVADASIYSDGTALFEDVADGAGPHLWTSTIVSGTRRRALLRFDVSAIPPGSTIRSVRLSLFQNRSRSDHPVTVHRLLASWTEGPANGGSGGLGASASAGDVTWVRRVHPGTPWTTGGGDFVATPSTSLLVGSIWGFRYEWPSSPAMIADVQGWVNRTLPNHGWILIGDEITPQSAKQFGSREGGASAGGPRLVIEADPPAPGPSDAEAPLPAWALGLLALGVGAALRGRRRGAGSRA